MNSNNFFSNYKHKLEPALIGPGRADVTVEFKNASRHICHGIFQAFYPVQGPFRTCFLRKTDVPLCASSEIDHLPANLTETDIEELAHEFALRIPEYQFSPAQIQGTLTE